MLLQAHRHGVPACCGVLRRIRRFSSCSDPEILAARVSLADAQHALALHYGYANWKEMCAEASTYPSGEEPSLAGVIARAEEEVPEYAGAGVPLGVVAAMNHAGIDIRYMEFAAASGWAFSFGYRYGDESPAHMAVRGEPGADGPFEIFAFLPAQYGLTWQMVPTNAPEEVWAFVTAHVDARVPVVSEHFDGGLIVSYRVKEGQRQIFFDGTVRPGWVAVEDLQPHGVYSLVGEGSGRHPGEIRRAALARAVGKATASDWKGVPQGIDALKRYLADVRDPDRDFRDCQAWFCWAAFQRLMARRCAAVWLGKVARLESGGARQSLSLSAEHYAEAFRWYERYLNAIRSSRSPRDLSEPPSIEDRIERLGPLLEHGIAEEAEGLATLAESMRVQAAVGP